MALPNGYDAVMAATVRVKSSDNGGGAAGTYTGSVKIPPDANIIDVILNARTLWDSGTSATGKVGDTVDDDGIFVGVDLKATDLLAGESISTALAGGKAGADVANSQFNRRTTFAGAQRTISLIVTTVGVTTAGETWMTVLYSLTAGPSPVSSTFVAT